MSIVVRDSGDIYFDGTNNVSVMSIFVDSASDLQGLVQYEDIYFQLGSDALDVSTGDKYRMKSNGTWILQPSDNVWQNVYTKTEIDSEIARIDSDIIGVEGDMSKLHSALNEMLNSSGKNKLQISEQTRTHNGVTFVVNSDGTVTANGTASGNAYIQIAGIPAQGGLFDGKHMLSGCPEGGSRQSYAMYAALSNYARYDYGSGVSLISTELTGNIGLVIMIYSGYTADNVVFKPMICTFADWDISTDYAPYCPTLYELYQLVKSYHP